MLSFAGVSLALPSPLLMEMLGQRFPVQALRSWCWRDSYATPDGIPPFDAPEPLSPEINTLVWPTQPTRWAYGNFIATGSQLVAIRTALSDESGGYGDFVIDDDTGDDVTVRMKLVQAYPLFQVTTTSTSSSSSTTCPSLVQDEDLYLLTFVDRRYYWWYKPAPLVDTCSWSTLFDEARSALGIDASSFTLGTVPTQYDNPSARWGSAQWVGYNANLFLEAAARFIGAKAVCRLDGTVVIQRPGQRQADITQYDTWSSKHLLGGKIPIWDALGAVPESVRVVFYDSDDTNYPCAKNPSFSDWYFTDFLATRSILSTATTTSTPCTTTAPATSPTTTTTNPFTCVNETNIVPSSKALVWADRGTDSELPDVVGEQIAFDWYDWRVPSISAIFSGSVPWVLSGLTDRLEFRHTHIDFDTRVIPASIGIENLIAPGVLCTVDCTNPAPIPTTTQPCTGNCEWTIVSGNWVQTGSSCSCPCECAPPLRCPPNSLPCATTKTPCVRYANGAPNPPECSSTTGPTTTSAPTTTSLPNAACDTSCLWYMDAAGQLWRYDGANYGASYNASNNICLKTGAPGVPRSECGECATPTGMVPCSSTETPCTFTTTTTIPCVPCGGGCAWVWDDLFATWIGPLVGSGCAPGTCNPSAACYCDPPATNGSMCSQYASTDCYDHTPGAVSTTSPNTPCGNGCDWQWSTFSNSWALVGMTCLSGCTCQAPGGSGIDDCDVAHTICSSIGTTTAPTTTAPTTTAPTTTTAPAGCLATCLYDYFCCTAVGVADDNGGYYCVNVTSSCGAPCECPAPSISCSSRTQADTYLACVNGGDHPTGLYILGTCAYCLPSDEGGPPV